jgi:hypothetical protein
MCITSRAQLPSAHLPSELGGALPVFSPSLDAPMWCPERVVCHMRILTRKPRSTWRLRLNPRSACVGPHRQRALRGVAQTLSAFLVISQTRTAFPLGPHLSSSNDPLRARRHDSLDLEFPLRRTEKPDRALDAASRTPKNHDVLRGFSKSGRAPRAVGISAHAQCDPCRIPSFNNVPAGFSKPGSALRS